MPESGQAIEEPIVGTVSGSEAQATWGDARGGMRLPFAHGAGVGVHKHRRGHLVYPASGVLSIITDAGTWIAPSNRIAWTPAGFEHRHLAYGSTDMRVLFLPSSLAARLPDRPAVFSVSPLAREAMLRLTPDTSTARLPAAQVRLRTVIVDDLVEASAEPLHLPEPRDDRLRALSDLLHENPADNSTLVELGRRVGASQRTLTRLFHEELGMGFRQWRTQLRLHLALVLLAEGHSVTATAASCGWANPTSFIEAFAGVLGRTPGHYRAHA
jgi:AraC-like DNA-binding protein/quercetin dioxygenase-like cupin family protein